MSEYSDVAGEGDTSIRPPPAERPPEPDRLEEIKTLWRQPSHEPDYWADDDVRWLIAEIERLRAGMASQPQEIAEACAKVCESRAHSLFHDSHRLMESIEANKCATAIRSGWSRHLPARLRDVIDSVRTELIHARIQPREKS